ncbi:hypothetical protein JHK87_040222 [Glycine soja]|nr:hypothetical protein JHK87_040222 [Glycine soja]
MVGVLPKRRILMQHGKSQGNRDTTTYTTTLHHNIQSMAQGMTQVLCAGEHLHRVMDSEDCSLDWRIQFYMSPYAHTQQEGRVASSRIGFQELSSGREEKWITRVEIVVWKVVDLDDNCVFSA